VYVLRCIDHILLDDSDDELNCELFSESICPASPESGTCTLEQLRRAFPVEKGDASELENTEETSFLDGPSDSNSNPCNGVSQILTFYLLGKDTTRHRLAWPESPQGRWCQEWNGACSTLAVRTLLRDSWWMNRRRSMQHRGKITTHRCYPTNIIKMVKVTRFWTHQKGQSTVIYCRIPLCMDIANITSIPEKTPSTWILWRNRTPDLCSNTGPQVSESYVIAPSLADVLFWKKQLGKCSISTFVRMIPNEGNIWTALLKQNSLKNYCMRRWVLSAPVFVQAKLDIHLPIN
jgi:hypothetical protein